MASQLPVVRAHGLAGLFSRCFSFCSSRPSHEESIALTEGLACRQPSIRITREIALKILGESAPCLEQAQRPWQEHAVAILTMPEEEESLSTPLLQRRKSRHNAFSSSFLETIEEEHEVNLALMQEQLKKERQLEEVFGSLGKMTGLEPACEYLVSCFRSEAFVTCDLIREVHALCYEDRFAVYRDYPLATRCFTSAGRILSSSISLFSTPPAPITEFESQGFGRVLYRYFSPSRSKLDYVYHLQHLEGEVRYRCELAIQEFKVAIAHVPCLAEHQRNLAYYKAALSLYLTLERLQPLGFGVKTHYLIFCYVLAQYDLGFPLFPSEDFARESATLCNILEEKAFAQDVSAALKRGEREFGVIARF